MNVNVTTLAVSGRHLFAAYGAGTPNAGPTLDLSTSTWTLSRVIKTNGYLAVSGGNLLVAQDGSVTAASIATGLVTRVVKGDRFQFDGLWGIAASGPNVFVASYRGTTVTEVNAATGALVRVIV